MAPAISAYILPSPLTNVTFIFSKVGGNNNFFSKRIMLYSLKNIEQRLHSHKNKNECFANHNVPSYTCINCILKSVTMFFMSSPVCWPCRECLAGMDGWGRMKSRQRRIKFTAKTRLEGSLLHSHLLHTKLHLHLRLHCHRSTFFFS